MATIKCTVDRSSWYEMYIEYSYSKTDVNKHTITHALKLKQLTDSYDFNGEMNVTYYINNESFAYKGNVNLNDKGNTGYTITIGTTHTTSITHDSTTGDGNFTVSCTGSCNSGGYGPGNISLSKTTVKLPRLPIYDLSISARSGSSITVQRTSSGGAGATGKLTGGLNKLYYGDKLKISFSADTNYAVLTHTVNNKSFTSGNTHTVSGDVSVESTATPLKSVIGATDANIGSTSIITVVRYNTSYTHTIAYSFGKLSGYITSAGGISSSSSKYSTTSIPFVIPESFYEQIPNDPSGVCTLTCTTYNGNNSLGSTTCKMTITAAKNICKPKVSGTVIDINDVTKALTGDETKLIRYKSDAKCTIFPEAQYKSSISSRNINNQTATRDVDGNYIKIFEQVETSTFTFKATDSRGYPGTYTAEPIIIPYIQLTCNPTIKRPLPTSNEIKLSVTGNVYRGKFGDADDPEAINNKLILQYRYREYGNAEDSYVNNGGWHTINSTDITYGTSSYTLNDVSLGDNFDYDKSYVFQISAYDGAVVDSKDYVLSEVVKTFRVKRGIPIFDWGENDFNFNVPVMSLGQNLTGVARAISSVTTCPVTVTPGTDANGDSYTINSLNAKLIGSTLRIYFRISRPSNISGYNITNEKIATVVVDHGGKIKVAYNMSSATGATGSVATFATNHITRIDNTKFSFDIYLCAATTSGREYGSFLSIPVVLNLDAFSSEVFAEEDDDYIEIEDGQ